MEIETYREVKVPEMKRSIEWMWFLELFFWLALMLIFIGAIGYNTWCHYNTIIPLQMPTPENLIDKCKSLSRCCIFEGTR